MMSFIFKVIVGLLAAILFINKLRGDMPINRKFIGDAIFTLGAAFAFSAVGVAVFTLLTPFADRFGLAGWALLLLFTAGYVATSALWIARFSPKARLLPRWVGPGFGVPDAALVVVMGLAGGALVVAGGGA